MGGQPMGSPISCASSPTRGSVTCARDQLTTTSGNRLPFDSSASCGSKCRRCRTSESKLVSILLAWLLAVACLSPGSARAFPLEDGSTYLEGAQALGGAWASSRVSQSHATGEAIRALQYVGGGTNSRDAAADFLESLPVADTDALARRIAALSGEARIAPSDFAVLVQLADPLGGWGLAAGFSSDPLDTALALSALFEADVEDGGTLIPGLLYLAASQNDDGGWACVDRFRPPSPSDVWCTAEVLRALAKHREDFDVDAAVQAGQAYLLDHLDAEGRIDGGSADSVITTGLAVQALRASGSTLNGSRSLVLDFLEGEQAPDGSWRGDPYVTAVALQGLASLAPAITSVPPIDTKAGQDYSYQVITDLGDALEFTLLEAPEGMTISTASGLIQWTPSDNQHGPHTVRVQVNDDRGLASVQAFTLVVRAADSNQPPVITSSPPTRAVVGRSYVYNIAASDPDAEDVLISSLVVAPDGMSVDPISGVVEWTPRQDQVGSHSVTVRVQDPSGLSGVQSYTLIVAQSPIASGVVIVANDEWPLSDKGFFRLPVDTARFARNVAAFFAGSSGSFHAYSNNLGFTGTDIASSLTAAGYSYSSGTAIPFDLSTLNAFDGLFLGGDLLDPDQIATLREYVAGGGNVYLAAGTSTSDPGMVAQVWNSFLEEFGLSIASTNNQIEQNVDVSGSTHPIFEGVSSLYQDRGQTITGAGIEVTLNGAGLFAVVQAAAEFPPGLDLRICNTIPVGGIPAYMAFAQERGELYAINATPPDRLSGGVFVIDTTTEELLGEIPLANGFPIGIAVSPDETTVYVAISRGAGDRDSFGASRLDVIDTASRTILDSVVLGGGPTKVAVHPDGSRAYVSDRRQRGILWVVDTDTNELTPISTGTSAPIGVVLSPDGSRVYTIARNPTTVSSFDTATNELTDTIGLSLLPAVRSASLGISPDGLRGYGTSTRESRVSVIDLDPQSPTFHQEIERFETSGEQLDGIAMFPSGEFAAIASEGTDELILIDTNPQSSSFHTEVLTIPVRGDPLDVAMDSSELRLFVSNSERFTEPSDEGSISVICQQSSADLTIESVDDAGVVVDGQSLEVSGVAGATIANAGTTAVAVPFDVTFFEDTNGNQLFDPEADTLLGTSEVTEPLAAGATRVISADLSGVVLFSSSPIWGFVDSGGVVTETNENNNLANTGDLCALSHFSDLVSDWSDETNPNGVWSYNEGTNPLPAVEWWQRDLGRDLGGWDTAQPAWAEAEDASNRLPVWFRSNGSETFTVDWLAGDVVMHSTDRGNGVGNGVGNVTWTSPLDGEVDIAGSVWIGRDIERSNDWKLLLNGVELTDGSVAHGDEFSRQSPFSFEVGSGGSTVLRDVPVFTGDVLELRIERTSYLGDFVGVNMTISSIVPQPDLTVSSVELDEEGTSPVISVRLGNAGSAVADAGVSVAFYDGNPEAAGILLGSAFTTEPLEPGASTTVSFSLSTGVSIVDTIWVAADGPGGTVGECNEDNNVHDSGLTISTRPVIEAPPDDDGDGFTVLVDCDDSNALVSPGATEILGNGRDDDCNPGTPDQVPDSENLTCRITTDKLTYGAQEEVAIEVVVTREGGTTSLVGLGVDVMLAATSGSLGGVLVALPPIAPAGVATTSLNIPTGTTPPGLLTASAEVLSGATVTTSCSATAEIIGSDEGGLSLVGTLEVVPPVAMVREQVVGVSDVLNTGNVTLDPASLELLIVDPESGDVEATLSMATGLDVGSSIETVWDFPLDLPAGQHLAVLRGGPDGSLETLDTAVLELECAPAEDPNLATQGFWKRVCSAPHPSGEGELLSGYVEFVNDFSVFGQVASVDGLCDRLNPAPKRNKCEQAEAQFMALLLNQASGRVEPCDCPWDPNSPDATIGDTSQFIDELLSNAVRTRADCVTAQDLADSINTGGLMPREECIARAEARTGFSESAQETPTAVPAIGWPERIFLAFVIVVLALGLLRFPTRGPTR